MDCAKRLPAMNAAAKTDKVRFMAQPCAKPRLELNRNSGHKLRSGGPPGAGRRRRRGSRFRRFIGISFRNPFIFRSLCCSGKNVAHAGRHNQVPGGAAHLPGAGAGDVAAYWPVFQCDFTNYDDDLYVTNTGGFNPV